MLLKGGGTFDFAGGSGSWVNRLGDVAFTAHVAGEEAQVPGFPPQAVQLSAITSLYVKKRRPAQLPLWRMPGIRRLAVALFALLRPR
jgi:hypothetical protein